MKTQATKPYLIRAIYEWCTDSGFTPYLAVKVDTQTRVPIEHVKGGEIVLNISQSATHRLTLGNEFIEFSARFNGVSKEISIPINAVSGIFAKENGQGLVFSPETSVTADKQKTKLSAKEDMVAPSAKSGKVKLQVIK
jgi:stringent starvation protein B